MRIRNRTTNAPATAPIAVIDGGFDPVAIQASPGDLLELTVTAPGGISLVFSAKVPPRRPPSVVRVNPTKGRTDVALNTRPVVIFSEPIDATTLNTTSLQLLRGSSPVPGTVALQVNTWTAEFTPGSPLEPGTTYELVVTRLIRDLDGDSLDAQLTSTFTTGAAGALTPGSIRVTASTTGADLPEASDFYRVVLDKFSVNRISRLDMGGEVIFSDVLPGSHTVWLENLPYNCDVDGDNPFSSTVSGNSTTLVAFAVTCKIRNSSITGTVTIDGQPMRGVPVYLGKGGVATPFGMTTDAEGGFAFSGLGAGEYSVLAWVPDYSCPEQFVRIAEGGTSAAAMACTPTPRAEIYVANADGSSATRLALGNRPAWSPDGRRIAFDRGFKIYVINDDGSNEIQIGQGMWPSWSPDGSRIVFSDGEAISVMSADGTGVTRLISNPYDGWKAWPTLAMPVWSPDGRLIAFEDSNGPYECCFPGIVVIDMDGSVVSGLLDVVRTRGPEMGPGWSPDGATLSFYGGIYLTDILIGGPRVYGLATVNIRPRVRKVIHTYCASSPCIPGNRYAGRTVWSPDGGRIAFTSASQDPFDPVSVSIRTIDSNGSESRQLIENGQDPAWSPDGARIAFVRYPGKSVTSAATPFRLRVNR